jgi:glycosyltransferase involved in cell wall biosynthesis
MLIRDNVAESEGPRSRSPYTLERKFSLIVVNCRHLTQEITGVQRFAEQIIRNLAVQRTDLVFVAPQGFTQSDAGYPVEAVGRLRGHAWEQIDLPRYLRRQGNPLLLNLMSTAPVYYTNKVMTAHDITYIRHPESFSRRFRALYGAIVPPALRRSHHILTVSEFSRSEISSHFGLDPERFIVVPNAVDTRFSPCADRAEGTAKPYLLTVSSTNRHKNFNAMVRAYQKSRLFPETELKVVGSHNRSFSDTGASTGHGVTFLGRVSDERLIELYRGATAFVFPSLYEGFGIPVLEAQASGTPVLAAGVASLPEVLGDSALFFDPHDVDQIAKRITQVATSANLREDLRGLGLKNVARFSWERSAQIVSNVLDGPKGSA